MLAELPWYLNIPITCMLWIIVLYVTIFLTTIIVMVIKGFKDYNKVKNVLGNRGPKDQEDYDD